MSEEIYNVDYFLKLFAAIPESQWCIDQVRDESGRRCAMGHCIADGGGAGHLQRLLAPVWSPAEKLIERDGRRPGNVEVQINDGFHPAYPQPTPRARILAALNEIKSKEAK